MSPSRSFPPSALKSRFFASLRMTSEGLRMTAGRFGCLFYGITTLPSLRLVDLVEDAAIGEMFLLRLLPAAVEFVNRKEVQFGKLLRISGCHGLEPGTKKILGGNLLPFLRIKKLEISLGHGLR